METEMETAEIAEKVPMRFQWPTAWKSARRYAETLRCHVLDDGRLESFGDGGYPLFYIARTGNQFNGASEEIVCPKCASDPDGDVETRITQVDVNWEDDSLFCDCGDRIPSAYADEFDCSQCGTSTSVDNAYMTDEDAADGASDAPRYCSETCRDAPRPRKDKKKRG